MSKPRTFSKLDVDRVLRRAAEIEGSEDGKPISVEELKSIAGEAGFGAHAVELAIREAQQAAIMPVPHPPVEARGLVIARLSASRTVPIDISSEQLMRAVRLFQPYREGPAQIKLGEERIRWHDMKGLAFTVSSAGGVTEIQVQVVKPLLRRARWSEWVKSAADRLQALVLLVASQPAAGALVEPTE
ncbi:MAG: hypothetical protein OEU54_10145 [Gemmatimonadota bacterium]|nr:hypothetical protein [Gemmatimonadota bacterium]